MPLLQVLHLMPLLLMACWWTSQPEETKCKVRHVGTNSLHMRHPKTRCVRKEMQSWDSSKVEEGDPDSKD